MLYIKIELEAHFVILWLTSLYSVFFILPPLLLSHNDSYYFLWISSKFVRKFNEQLTYTARATKTKGGALNVEQLLIGANEVYNGRIQAKDLDSYFNNEEIIFKEI